MRSIRLNLSRLLGFKIVGASNSGIGSAKIGVKPDVSDMSEVERVSTAGDKGRVQLG